MALLKLRHCFRCGRKYQPTAHGQKYCGNQKTVGTCSYRMGRAAHDKWVTENRPLLRGYHKAWWDRFRQDKRRYRKYLQERKRKGQKLRFTILARDNFTCRYCGRKAPNVELQVDHVLPRAKGGKTTLSNLMTACVDCNVGKSDSLLP